VVASPGEIQSRCSQNTSQKLYCVVKNKNLSP